MSSIRTLERAKSESYKRVSVSEMQVNKSNHQTRKMLNLFNGFSV